MSTMAGPTYQPRVILKHANPLLLQLFCRASCACVAAACVASGKNRTPASV
jgi:hypothetical protein